jgi:hypothetical protein
MDHKELTGPTRTGWDRWMCWLGGEIDGFAPDVLRVRGMSLDPHVYKDNVYVALSIGSLHHPMLDLEFQQTTWAHITVGSYRISPDADQATEWRKMHRKIEEARRTVMRWQRFSAMGDGAKIWLLAKPMWTTCGPAVLDLRLCNEPWSINRLISRLEVMFSGSFKLARHDLPRTMLYLPGPTFHLSLYNDFLVKRKILPPQEDSPRPPPPPVEDEEDYDEHKLTWLVPRASPPPAVERPPPPQDSPRPPPPPVEDEEDYDKHKRTRPVPGPPPPPAVERPPPPVKDEYWFEV